MPEDKVSLFSTALEAFTQRDHDALEPFLDDGIEWEPTLAAGAPEGTTYRGKKGIRTYREALHWEFDDFSLEVESLDEVFPNHILFRGRTTGMSRTTGARLDAPLWALWAIRDGKLVRGWSFFSEREALEAVRAAAPEAAAQQ